MIGITHYLLLGALLFVCGLLTILLKRHAMGILMGVEMMLNAANVNLIAFAHYGSGGNAIDGQLYAMFVIVVAAAEAAVALAIFLNFYNNFATIDVDRGNTLRG